MWGWDGDSRCCSLWLGSGRPSRRQLARDHALAQQLRSLSDWHRAAEVEALYARAPGVHEKFQLSVGLDAFGDDLDVKLSREADCRSDDRRAAVIVGQTVHELLRDLDFG